MSQQNGQDEKFSPDPIYSLGNAWIAFGDLLDEKIAAMAGAEFAVTSGGWVGEASNSMSAAFQNNAATPYAGNSTGRAGLRYTVEQCAEACWELGEQINYFGMLRNEQAIAEQKLALVQLLAGVLGAVLGLLSGIFLEGFAVAVGAVLASVASKIGSWISRILQSISALDKAVGTVTQGAARFTAGIGDMFPGAATIVGKVGSFFGEAGSAGVGAAGRRSPWSLVTGRVAVYGTDFIVNNAVSTAAANAAVGLPTDWKNWKPVPTDAEGWLNFIATGIMLYPIMRAGSEVFAGPSGKFTGWVTTKVDRFGGTGGTGGIVNSKTDPNLFTPGGSGDGGRTTAGSSGTVTPGPSKRLDSGARPVTNSRTGSGGDGGVHQPITIRDAHNVQTDVRTTDIGGPAVRVTGGRAIPDSAQGTDVSAPSSHTVTPGITPQPRTAHAQPGTPRVTVDNSSVDGVRSPSAGHGSGQPTGTDPVVRTAPDPVARTAPDPVVRTAPDPVARTAPDPVTRTGAGSDGGTGRTVGGSEGGTSRTTGGAASDSGPAGSRSTAPVQRAAAPVSHGEPADGARTAEEATLSGAAPHGDVRSQGSASTGGSRSQEPVPQGGTRRAESTPPGVARAGGASDAAAHRTDSPGGQVAPRPVDEAARPAGTSSRAGEPYVRPAAAPRGPLGERGPDTAVSEGDAGARPPAERPGGADTPARTAATTAATPAGRPVRNAAETPVGAGTVEARPVDRTSRSARTADAQEGRGADHVSGSDHSAEGARDAAHDAASGAVTGMLTPAGLRLGSGLDGARASDRGPGATAVRESQDAASGHGPDGEGAETARVRDPGSTRELDAVHEDGPRHSALAPSSRPPADGPGGARDTSAAPPGDGEGAPPRIGPDTLRAWERYTAEREERNDELLEFAAKQERDRAGAIDSAHVDYLRRHDEGEYGEYGESAVGDKGSLGYAQAVRDFDRATVEKFKDRWQEWAETHGWDSVQWAREYARHLDDAHLYFANAAQRTMEFRRTQATVDDALAYEKFYGRELPEDASVPADLAHYESGAWSKPSYRTEGARPRPGEEGHVPASISELRSDALIGTRRIVDQAFRDFPDDSAARREAIDSGTDALRAGLGERVRVLADATERVDAALGRFDKDWKAGRLPGTAMDPDFARMREELGLDNERLHLHAEVRARLRLDLHTFHQRIHDEARAEEMATNGGLWEFPLDEVRGRWDDVLTKTFDSIQDRIDHAEFLRSRSDDLDSAVRTAFERNEEDFAVATLGDDARDRLTTELRTAHEQVVDEAFFRDPRVTDFRAHPLGRWDGDAGRPARDYRAGWDALQATVDARIGHELDLHDALKDGAAHYDRLRGHDTTGRDRWGRRTEELFEDPGREHADLYTEIKDDVRGETAEVYDTLFAPHKHDIKAWLQHEEDHGNAFQARLDALEAERPAPHTPERDAGTETDAGTKDRPADEDAAEGAERSDDPVPTPREGAGVEGFVPLTDRQAQVVARAGTSGTAAERVAAWEEFSRLDQQVAQSQRSIDEHRGGVDVPVRVDLHTRLAGGLSYLERQAAERTLARLGIDPAHIRARLDALDSETPHGDQLHVQEAHGDQLHPQQVRDDQADGQQQVQASSRSAESAQEVTTPAEPAAAGGSSEGAEWSGDRATELPGWVMDVEPVPLTDRQAQVVIGAGRSGSPTERIAAWQEFSSLHHRLADHERYMTEHRAELDPAERERLRSVGFGLNRQRVAAQTALNRLGINPQHVWGRLPEPRSAPSQEVATSVESVTAGGASEGAEWSGDRATELPGWVMDVEPVPLTDRQAQVVIGAGRSGSPAERIAAWQEFSGLNRRVAEHEQYTAQHSDDLGPAERAALRSVGDRLSLQRRASEQALTVRFGIDPAEVQAQLAALHSETPHDAQAHGQQVHADEADGQQVHGDEADGQQVQADRADGRQTQERPQAQAVGRPVEQVAMPAVPAVRVGGVPRAPDDEYESYDEDGQVGVSPETEQLALEVLARLEGAEPDLLALAARLLHRHIPASDPVPTDDLYELLAAAARANRAGSLAVIGAFDLDRRGALDDRWQLYDSNNRPAGRSWTDENVRPRLDRYQAVHGPTGHLAEYTAPWTRRPWVVRADGGPDGLLLRDREGRVLGAYDWEEFAELLRHDTTWRNRRDLVVAVDEAGSQTLVGPARIADVVGVRTWSTNREVSWSAPAPDGAQRLLLDGRPALWIPNAPDQRRYAVPGVVTDALGRPISDDEIASTTAVAADGQRTLGRVMADPEEEVTWDADGRETEVTHYFIGERVVGQNGRPAVGRRTGMIPLSVTPAYRMGFHAVGATWGVVPLVEAPSRYAPLAEVAGYFARRGSFRALAPGGAVLVTACEVAQFPDGTDDPLEHPRGIQTVANTLDRPAIGANVEVSFQRSADGRPSGLMLVTPDIDDPNAAYLVTAYPEPERDELALWAQRIGGSLAQHPDPARELLRWLRAIREVPGYGQSFGPRETRFERVMRAFETLNAERVAGGGTFSLTLQSLWDFIRPENDAAGAPGVSFVGLQMRLDALLANATGGVPRAPEDALDAAAETVASAVESVAEPVQGEVVGPEGVGRSVAAGVLGRGGEAWWRAREAAGAPVVRRPEWTSVNRRTPNDAGKVEPTTVAGSFRVRRFEHGGVTYTDLEVTTGLRTSDQLTARQLDDFWERLSDDIERVWNAGHRLPNGDVLHVTPVRVPYTQGGVDWWPKVYVPVKGDDGTTHHRLPVGLVAGSRVGAHEFGHQLGLPDEYREKGVEDPEAHLDVAGSIMGRYALPVDPEDVATYEAEAAAGRTSLVAGGLVQGGVRDRNLMRIGPSIGELPVAAPGTASRRADDHGPRPVALRVTLVRPAGPEDRVSDAAADAAAEYVRAARAERDLQERVGTGVGGSGDAGLLAPAALRTEAAAERFVAAETLRRGSGARSEGGPAPVESVSGVVGSAAERAAIAAELTAEDLMGEPAGLSLAGVREALGAPGELSREVRAVAAQAAWRLWREAAADFREDAAAAAGRTSPGAVSDAWDVALGLVLPAELHPEPADFRYAGQAFRDAVREVAEHALARRTAEGWARDFPNGARGDAERLLARITADDSERAVAAGVRQRLGLPYRQPGGAPDRVTAPAAPAEGAEPALIRTFGPDVVYEPHYEGLVAALHILQGVVAGREGRQGEVDLDAFTRWVTGVGPHAELDGSQQTAVLHAVERAHAVGRARSIHEIRASWLVHALGALGPATDILDVQGAFLGRDFSGGTNWPMAPGLVAAEAADGTVGQVEGAPWGHQAYLVRTAVSADLHRPVVLGIEVEPEVLAALLSLDPLRPFGEEVALLASGLGADRGEPARIVADALEVRVWSTYGAVVSRELDDGTGARAVVLRTQARSPLGRWIPSDPGLARIGSDVYLRGNNERFPESDVISYTLPTTDGRQLLGRAYFDSGDMAARAKHLWRLSEATHYIDVEENIPGLPRRSGPPRPLPLPFPLERSYVEFGHGNQGRAVLPRRSTGRSHYVRPDVIERLGRRSRSLQRLPADWPEYLLYCDIGHLPPGVDRLVHVPIPQGRANNDNRLVVTSDGQTGPRRPKGTLPPLLVKFDNPDAPQYRWLVFAPEPGTDRLADLADRAGLPAHVADRPTWALRWIRAIRHDFDHTADTDPAFEQWLGELIEGFGALERHRLAADPAAGPLTWRVLELVLDAHVTAHGVPVGQRPLEALLRHARAGGAVQVFAEPPAGGRRQAAPAMPASGSGHGGFHHSGFDPAEVFGESGHIPWEEEYGDGQQAPGTREQEHAGTQEQEQEQERGRRRHRTEPPARPRAAPPDPRAARAAAAAPAHEGLDRQEQEPRQEQPPREREPRSDVVRPSMLEPGEPRTASGPPLIVLTPPSADSKPPAGHEDPARSPWYTRHGMLGEAEVTDVPRWTAEDAVTAAAEVVDRLAFDADASEAVRQAVRDNVRDMLLERGARAGRADRPVEAWNDILLHGRLVEADSRLVWLRPVLDGGSAVQQSAGPADPVRRYNVSFNSTTAEHVATSAVTHAADAILLTAINVASAAASAAVLGVPQIAASSSHSELAGDRRNVISGRKLFVNATHDFTAGLRIRVFVDGREQPAADAARPPVVDRGLAVRFPAELSGHTEPRPVLTEPAPREVRSRPHQRLRRAGEVLHAIDLTPVLADLQRRLRGGLGVPAGTVRQIVEQAQPMFNEKTARNRSRWWLTSGDTGTKVRTGRTLKGFRAFRGHPLVRMSVESAQFLQVASGVAVREDWGVGITALSGRGGDSGLSLTGGLNMTGLVDPGLDSAHDVKGLAPLFGATAVFGRGWDHQLASQGLGHMIVNTTEDQARYRMRMRVEVEWTSRTHPGLSTVASVVEAELGVPWRGGEGAAEFERRVLGRLHTRYVREALVGAPTAWPAGLDSAGPKVWPEPVDAQPHVRALLAAAKIPPGRRYRRPASLNAPRTAHPKEPLWLAARKGIGFPVGAALPGAELVEDHFRARLEELSRPSGGMVSRAFEKVTGRHDPARGRSTADNKLATTFGRPALEGKLVALLGGVKEEITYGGRRYELGVRGHLTEHLEYRAHSAKVNSRAAMGEGVVGGRKTKWRVLVGGGGALRLGIGRIVRLQMGGGRVFVWYGRGRDDSFESVAKSYRRTETVGDVHEHVYNIVYELTLRPLSGEGRAETWFVHRDDSIVAQILVPDEHAPAIPPSPAEIAAAGRITVLSALPVGRRLDLKNATSGLYPVFQSVPDLARVAARAYARLHGLDADAAGDFARLPRKIADATGPDELASYFSSLTDGWGRDVELPGRDGWKTTMVLHLAAHDPRRLPDEPREVEIEQYAQSVRRRNRETHSAAGLGVRTDLGPQARFGSDQGGEADAAHSDAGTVQDTPAPGGRFAFLFHGQYEYERASSNGSVDGSVDISRATYGGKKLPYRADAVFTVTMIRYKGRKVEVSTTHLRADGAMDVLIPERLLEDVLPADAAVRHAEQLGAGPVQDRAEPAEAGTEPAEEADAGPRRVYAAGHIPVTGAFVERLDADVLGAVRKRLRDVGVLPARTTADDTAVDALEPVSRALRAAFRPDALKTGKDSLFDTGVWIWLKDGSFGGASRGRFVQVVIDSVDAADVHRSRPEVDLTLRGESTGEHKEGVKSRRGVGFGVVATGRGGEHAEDSGVQGHGGLDVAAGWSDTLSRGTEHIAKDVFIYRANTKGGSEEFQHNIRLRLEVGTTLDLPSYALLGTAPGRLIELGAGAVAGIFDRRDEFNAFLHTLRPWVRYDDGADRLVPGRIRLLVPRYLTVPVPPGTTAEPGPAFVREYGRSPQWRDAVSPPPALSDELREKFHPWDVPAAAAVQRWTKVAAVDAGRESRLHRDVPWDVAGIDFSTTAGLGYVHHTSHATLRPRSIKLLEHLVVVKVGGREVTVGFELFDGVEYTPSANEVRHKARQYRQQDVEEKNQAEHERGWYAGAGPEGGGGSGQDAFLGRIPFERFSDRGGNDAAALAETEESNRESTRDYRYFRFRVRAVMTPSHRPGRQLTIDVPGGLVAMLPFDAADRLVAELLARHAETPAVPATPAAASGQEDPHRSGLDLADVPGEPGHIPREEEHGVGRQAGDTGEQERGPRHRTEPPALPRALPVDDLGSVQAADPATAARDRTAAESVPAPRPALAGLNLDAIPVGRAPAGRTSPEAAPAAPERAEAAASVQSARQTAPAGTAASERALVQAELAERVEPAGQTAPAGTAAFERAAVHAESGEGVEPIGRSAVQAAPADSAPPEQIGGRVELADVVPSVAQPARQTMDAGTAHVEQAAAGSGTPERARMLSITPLRTPFRFALDGAQSGLSAEELDSAQAALTQADPAPGEAYAAGLGARVAAEIGARWAAEGLDPSRAGLELRMEDPARFAVAMVLARAVAETLRHRVHVAVGRMAPIEMCPSEGGGA